MSVRFETLPANKAVTRVWLNSQLVGEVRRVEGGYQYVPRSSSGTKHAGPVFTSESACRRSITGGDEE